MRTRAYRRNEREKHIRRKENIIKSYALDSIPYYYNASDRFNGIQYNWRFSSSIGEGNWESYWYVKHRGMLDGQIYCSCPCCTRKTRNKGHRRTKGHRRHYPNYYPSINYKPSDQRKIDNMKEQEKEFRLVV